MIIGAKGCNMDDKQILRDTARAKRIDTDAFIGAQTAVIRLMKAGRASAEDLKNFRTAKNRLKEKYKANKWEWLDWLDTLKEYDGTTYTIGDGA